MTQPRKPNTPPPSGNTPRRWPDLLIGLLALLLLGGFGALMWQQNHPATASTSTVTPTEPTIPTSPDTVEEPVLPDVQAGVEANPATAEATTDTPTPATDNPVTTASEPETGNSPESTATTPATDTSAASTPPAATTEPPVIAAEPITPAPSQEPAVSTPPPPSADNPQATSTQTQAETPDATVAVATSASRVPLRSDYRISLGTFSTAQTVRTQTAAVSRLGYTVYPIDLGDQYVAQIGPFADEASARQALADIQRAYPGALMYPPRASASGSTSSDTNNTAADNSSASSSAATPTPAPDGPIYLQVGAFDRLESAQRLVQQLRDLGYNPTVNAPEGRKVTVMVGPYTGGALTRTEARLNANGLDHFRVR